MASTFSDLKIQLMATGENSGTWGEITNTNLGTAIEEAITGSASVAFSSADVTLTLTNTNATQTARNLRLNLTGTSGGARNLIVPAIEKVYIINNGLADTVTVKNAAGTGIAVPAGKTMYVYNNGTNVVDAITHLTSLTTGALTSTSTTVLNGTTIPASKTLVDTDSVQTLTNKTIAFASNTLTDVASTNTAQTLTNKSINLANNTLTATSAQIAAAVTDETGTGALVFANSPTLVTPALGTPASGVVTNLTGTASININGTVGASTPSTVASTNLSYTGTLTGGTGVINIGSGQVFKDASGNLGLGTSLPTSKLDVAGGATLTNAAYCALEVNSSTIRGQIAANAGGSVDVRAVSNHPLNFFTNNAQRVHITNTGNVAIGLSDALNSSRLSVLGETAINTTSFLSSTGTLALSSPADGTLNQCGITMRPFDSANQPSFGAIFTETVSTSSFRSNLVSTYTADNGGGAYIIRQFIPNSASTVERLRIDPDGNLLVGTTFNAGAKFNTFTNINTGIATFRNLLPTGITNDQLQVTVSQSTNLSQFHFHRCYSNVPNSATVQFGVRGDGVIFAQATTIQSLSDIRTKENVRNSSDGLKTILDLRPVRFDFKEGFGNNRKNQLGFIAQEVETVFPDAVDLAGEKDENGDPYKSVGPSAMIPVLVKAIQELSAKVDTLQAELNTLKGT